MNSCQPSTSYSTSTGSSSNDQEKVREQQLRHYKLLEQLQELVNKMPPKYQLRLPNEMLSRIANCMLDPNFPLIISSLKDIQVATEERLQKKRRKILEERSLDKKLAKQVKQKHTLNKYEKGHEAKSDEHWERELSRMDMKIVMELDQLLSEQQVTLEKAGTPGFFVSNKPVDIKLQVHILNLIDKLIKSNNDKQKQKQQQR